MTKPRAVQIALFTMTSCHWQVGSAGVRAVARRDAATATRGWIAAAAARR